MFDKRRSLSGLLNVVHSFVVDGQCHTNRSNSLTCDTCINIDGVCDNVTGTCYYTTFECYGFQVNAQCYTNRSSTMSCLTCQLVHGYYYSTSSFRSARIKLKSTGLWVRRLAAPKPPNLDVYRPA